MTVSSRPTSAAERDSQLYRYGALYVSLLRFRICTSLLGLQDMRP